MAASSSVATAVAVVRRRLLLDALSEIAIPLPLSLPLRTCEGEGPVELSEPSPRGGSYRCCVLDRALLYSQSGSRDVALRVALRLYGNAERRARTTSAVVSSCQQVIVPKQGNTPNGPSKQKSNERRRRWNERVAMAGIDTTNKPQMVEQCATPLPEPPLSSLSRLTLAVPATEHLGFFPTWLFPCVSAVSTSRCRSRCTRQSGCRARRALWCSARPPGRAA